MNAITFLKDETHHRRIMQIDLDELSKDEDILEDIYDLLSIEMRKDEEVIPWEKLKKEIAEQQG